MRSISAVLYLLFVRHLGSINSHPNPLKPSQTLPKTKLPKTMPSGNTDTAAVSEALAAHGYTVLPNGTMVKKENNSK